MREIIASAVSGLTIGLVSGTLLWPWNWRCFLGLHLWVRLETRYNQSWCVWLQCARCQKHVDVVHLVGAED